MRGRVGLQHEMSVKCQETDAIRLSVSSTESQEDTKTHKAIPTLLSSTLDRLVAIVLDVDPPHLHHEAFGARRSRSRVELREERGRKREQGRVKGRRDRDGEEKRRVADCATDPDVSRVFQTEREEVNVRRLAIATLRCISSRS